MGWLHAVASRRRLIGAARARQTGASSVAGGGSRRRPGHVLGNPPRRGPGFPCRGPDGRGLLAGLSQQGYVQVGFGPASWEADMRLPDAPGCVPLVGWPGECPDPR